MFQVHTTRFNSWSVSWCCDHCCDATWPVFRIVGYPTADAWELVEEGRAVIKGCLVEPGQDDFDYECPKCEVGVDMPMAYRDDDLA